MTLEGFIQIGLKKRRRNGRGVKSQGFSVLEAMVAMAILAAAMLPLLHLQGQFMRTITGFERASDRIAIRENVVNLIAAQNIDQNLQGEFIQGQYRIQWQARPLQPAQIARDVDEGEGRFTVSIYSVEVVVTTPFRQTDRFHIKALGWTAIRPVIGEL